MENRLRKNGEKFEPLSAGEKRGRLTLLREIEDAPRSTWLCECDCGKTKGILASSILCGKSTSCGCYAIEVRRSLHKKHGAYSDGNKSPEIKALSHLKERCFNPNVCNYSRYGGRGITGLNFSGYPYLHLDTM